MKPYTTTLEFRAEPAYPAKWTCSIEGGVFTQANDLINVYDWFRSMILEQAALAIEVARSTMLEF